MKDQNIISKSEVEINKEQNCDILITDINQISSLMDIVVKDKDLQMVLKDIILLEKYFLKISNDNVFLDLKKQEFEINLIPNEERASFTIFCSLLFKLRDVPDDMNHEIKKEIDPKKEIIVKMIDYKLEDGDWQSIIKKIGLNWGNIQKDELAELHLYIIKHENLIEDGPGYAGQTKFEKIRSLNLSADREYKKIYMHEVPLSLFFTKDYLLSFYKQQIYNKETKDYELNSLYQRESVRRMNIFKFIGLEWAIIRKLFEYNGLILSSGSVSLRHKLTLVDYKLSRFLSWMGLSATKSFHLTTNNFERFIDTTRLEEEIMLMFRLFDSSTASKRVARAACHSLVGYILVQGTGLCTGAHRKMVI
jgi:hypothetical protein